MDTIRIGGKDHPCKLTYNDYEIFMKRYFLLKEHDGRLKEKGKAYNWNYYVFWTVWKCLEKKGVWPFRKPFRSIRHMSKSILFEEFNDVSSFMNSKILKTSETKREDKESKN